MASSISEAQFFSNLNFKFHKSVRLEGARKTLRRNIEEHGGQVVGNDMAVDILLFDPENSIEDRHRILLRYAQMGEGNMEMQVEPVAFVTHCCTRGKLIPFTKRVDKGQPGRRPMSEGGPRTFYRMPFTTADDQNLATYLALSIPEADRGGRLGNSIYQQLVELGDDKSLGNKYSWAKRHPWNSWRERYKKNQERLSAMIDAVVKDLRQRHDEGTLEKMYWPRDASARKRRIHYPLPEEKEEEEEEEEGDGDEDEDDQDEISLSEEHNTTLAVEADEVKSVFDDNFPSIQGVGTQATLVASGRHRAKTTSPVISARQSLAPSPDDYHVAPEHLHFAPSPLQDASLPLTHHEGPSKVEPNPKASPRKARQRRLVTTSLPDGPYRNTRARSRSVEPVHPAPPFKSTTKRAKSVVSGVVESGVTQPETIMEEHSEMPESFHDEHNVIEMLRPLATERQTSRAKRKRSPSLSSDDARIDATIRDAQQRRLSGSFLRSSADLDHFKRSRKRQAVARPMPRGIAGARHNGHPPSTPASNARIRQFRRKPGTPRTQNQDHGSPGSSVDSESSRFPLEGTQASDHKRRRRKSDIYVPHSSTRAARFLSGDPLDS